ncbi:MAG: hypothetical protein ACREER_09965, partial [Alphaproteobacteria bacterium]
ITKRLDAAWVVGTNQGGIDTGAKAATTMYAVWLIKRSDTGVVDALFSTSFTAPTMPASYDRKRLIGSVVTDATPNIIAYTQAGDYFRYTGDVIQDISDATITSDTFETGTVSVPPSCLAHLYTLNSNPTATNSPGRIVVRTVGAADAPNTDSENFASIETSGTFDHVAATGWVLTNASRQIEYAASAGTGSSTVTIRTIGFTMLTRTNP